MKIPFFNKPVPLDVPPSAPRYVHAVRIDGLNDPFDAEDLWEAPRLAYASEVFRLRQALESRPQRLKGRKVVEVYGHVQVLLPSAVIVRDRRAARGAGAKGMAARLTELHRQDLGDKVKDADVRYQVLASAEVPDGSALVRFGLGIHVPAVGVRGDSESPVSEGTTNRILRCRIQASVDGGVIFTPLADVCADERLTVLGADFESASHVVPQWPFSREVSLVLINEPGLPLEMGAEPFGALSVSPGHAPNEYRIDAAIADSAATPALVLRVLDDRLSIDVPAPPAELDCANAENQRLTPAANVKEQDLTYVAHRPAPLAARESHTARTYVPQRRRASAQMCLAGLALQRVSLYGDAGITGLEIGFDAELSPVRVPGRAWLRLCVDATDRLSVVTRSGRQAVDLPTHYNQGSRSLHVCAAPGRMADHMVALVLGDFGMRESVPEGTPLPVGRGQKLLESLRVLDGAAVVRMPHASAEVAASGDQMGLSRRAFCLESHGDSLIVTDLAPSQLLFHLDERLGLLAVLDGAKADIGRLQQGHHLVGGHYIWQFQAPVES